MLHSCLRQMCALDVTSLKFIDINRSHLNSSCQIVHARHMPCMGQYLAAVVVLLTASCDATGQPGVLEGQELEQKAHNFTPGVQEQAANLSHGMISSVSCSKTRVQKWHRCTFMLSQFLLFSGVVCNAIHVWLTHSSGLPELFCYWLCL